MRKSIRRYHVSRVLYRPLIIWLAMVIAVFAAVRVLSGSRIGTEIEQRIKAIGADEETVKKVINIEFGNPIEENEYYKMFLGKNEGEETMTGEEEIYEEHTAESSIPEIADKPEVTEEIDPNTPKENIFGDGTQPLDPSKVQIDNDSGYEIDVSELLNSPLQFTVNKDEPCILIVHTHGSEAYTPDGDDIYVESDPYRTEDLNYNVVKVGDVLTEELESRGLKVLHDRTLHDYPSYNGSYSRSFDTIAKYLDTYPSIKIVIDLHRDAIANPDGSQYRTYATIDGKNCSQLLFVMGTDASGLSHPVWRENLKLALKLEYAMNILYPSLAKPIAVSHYRYNQHMTAGSMILEVGCTGNTLEESVQAVKYFAEAAEQVLETVSK